MITAPSTTIPVSWFNRYLYRNYRSFFAVYTRFLRHFTAAGWIVLFAMAVTAALGTDTNASMAYQAFTLLACLILVAALSCRFMKVPFEVKRSLPRFGSAGTPLPYRITVRNLTRRLQPGLGIVEELEDPRPSLHEFASTPEPGEEKRNLYDRIWKYYRWMWLIEKNRHGKVKEAPLPSLPPGGEIEVNLEILPLRRGVLRFEGTSLACPDPFGLVRAFKRIPAPDKVLVLPKRYPVKSVALPGATKYQQGGVALAASIGESEEFISLRDYRPGDPLRRIHWRSWAKTGQPIVKEFQDEYFVRHALILDTFGDTAFSDVFEEAVSVAASFACTIQTQDTLLDLMFVGPQAYCFTAGRGLAHVEQMLEILASVKVCLDQPVSSLSRLVLDHSKNVSGCICVFIAWDDTRRELVARLKQLGLPIRVFVVTRPGEKLDPGPMSGDPGNFFQLEVGKAAEVLARL